MLKSKVLVVDDEIRVLEAVERILSERFIVRLAQTPAEAEGICEGEVVHVILCDQRMPELTGVAFLRRVRERWPEIVRIILSGYTDPADIIEGINEAGIYQYVMKPWHPDHLLLTVENAARLYALQREGEIVTSEMNMAMPAIEHRLKARRARLKSAFRLDSILRAPGSPLEAACELTARVADYDVPVVITGESGSGKELFARALHYGSARADKPFVVLNCGALPDTLLESELFGYRRGAFTGAVSDYVGLFEQADGGTIFLDEIGEISPAFQVKLLRVVQDGEVRPLGSPRRTQVDVRLIAATNCELEQAVRDGRFREDLYYRLAVIRLRLPPLRERICDLERLCQMALEQATRLYGKVVTRLHPEVVSCFQAYAWPGNVRELTNEIQRMVVLAEDEVLGPELVSPHIRASVTSGGPRGGSSGALKGRVACVEAGVLRDALARHDGNKSRVAAELGLSRAGLRAKLARYGLAGQQDEA